MPRRFAFSLLALLLLVGLVPALSLAFADAPVTAGASQPGQVAAVTALAPLRDIRQIAAGGAFVCAATTSGGVKCWGHYDWDHNVYNIEVRSRPPVDILPSGSGVVWISAGYENGCAVTANGGVKCWGTNTWGQLGVEDSSWYYHDPVAVTGLQSGVASVTEGAGHTCALTAGGGVKCWGDNSFGELGDGTTTKRWRPADVAGLSSGVSTIVAGSSHTCAVLQSGAVKCWGKNDVGQLGDGTTTNRSLPVDVTAMGPGSALGLALGSWSTCALTTSGGVKCWGSNGSGQLGDGTKQSRPYPTDVFGLTSGVSAITASDSHVCALTSSGELKCWGSNGGALGDGTLNQQTVPVGVVGLGLNVAAVTAGSSHTCALLDTGTVKCWGSNYHSQLGVGASANRAIPGDVLGLGQGVRAVSATSETHCAVTAAGAVECWGSNYNGILADDSLSASQTPVDISGLASGVKSVSVGGAHACVLTEAGGAKCWGNNADGQIGDGTTTRHLNPVNVSGATNGLQAVDAGGWHTCALTTAGSVKCWGRNDSGQVGDNSTAARYTPVNVVGLGAGNQAVVTGYYHSCVLTAVGGVKCWGDNAQGQLGDGTTTDRLVPVDVTGLTSGVKSISATYSETCAVTTAGAVKCWGYRYSTTYLTPHDEEAFPTGIEYVLYDGRTMCALTTSRGVRCAGHSYSGQLGNGATSGSGPSDVIGLASGVKSISRGNWTFCALMDSGAVKCWGSGNSGQLGDGNAWRTTPQDVLAECYTLSISHSGSGTDPVANPVRSTGCASGYSAGEIVNFSAAPAAGWRVSSWSGTANDASQENTNFITMPAQNSAVSVTYVLNPSPTPTATATHTQTPTPTGTSTPTATLTPTPTDTRPPSGEGDSYEADDTCALARFIPADGAAQAHTFHKQADTDWVAFNAVAGTTYLINGDIAAGSRANLAVVPYRTCTEPLAGQNYDHSPNVRLEFQAQATGPIYLKLVNDPPSVFGPDAGYRVSVRAMMPDADRGALVLVAGRLRENDPVQPNIHNVANRAYRVFLDHGYTADDIQFLATNMNLAGVDTLLWADSLRAALTTWARSRVGPDRPLTLFIVDHGTPERVYLDGPRGEQVSPEQLDAWLDELEGAQPGVKVNVIIEACQSGSFIDGPGTLSAPGRVVITSADARSVAFTSQQGASFSDAFLDALSLNASLNAAFQTARWSVNVMHSGVQAPWLDDNGNAAPNEDGDGRQADQRGFSYAGTLAGEKWAPYIAEASGPDAIRNAAGVIRARVLDNPEDGVRRVWAVVYPPSYRPPQSSSELVREVLPTIVLLDQGGGWYAASYTGFSERGQYRIVVYAEDGEGLEAAPVAVIFGSRIYLPLVVR